MLFWLERLASGSARRPWLTIAAWVLALMALGTVSSRLLGGVLTTEFEFTNQAESRRAMELLQDRLTGPQRATELLIVRHESLTVQDAEFRSFVQRLQADVAALGPDLVRAAVSVYDTEDPAMVSRDGHATLVTVPMAGTFDDAQENVEDLHGVTDPAEGNGFEVLVAGEATIFRDFNEIAERDLRIGETVGIGVALVVLAVVFGALVAAILPIAMAIAAIVVALGLVALIGQVVDFSFFVTNMVTMMGLAVGIDYSLFIVSRYREERRAGRDKLDAISMTGATANRAVFFSGMTVVLALVGLLLIPNTIFRSLGTGAILVVLVSVAASLTLLPAVMGLLGDRLNALRILRRRQVHGADGRGGFWDRMSHGVMRRPVISLVIAAGILIAAALNYFALETGFAGVSTLPEGTESKQAFTVLARDFAAGGATTPVQIVVDGDVASAQQDIGELQALLAQDPALAPSQVQPIPQGDLTLVSVPVAGDPSSEEATRAVERIRSDYIPRAFEGSDAEVLVGGQPAMAADFFDITDRYTPFVFLTVLGLSFLLLTVVFRSIVVPIKAIIMNLLSVGAAYGLVVLVFQKGVGADLLGFQQVERVEAWLPLFLFSVLFGLSMDYHVFLLSRIRERWDHRGNNAESVAFGLRTTAGIITGAALIMVAVFGGFAAGDLVMMQQMGFGLAVAVFLDATLIRSVVVPASMRLLGDLNWYLPRWLQWLPAVSVEGEAAAPTPAPVPALAGDEPR